MPVLRRRLAARRRAPDPRPRSRRILAARAAIAVEQARHLRREQHLRAACRRFVDRVDQRARVCAPDRCRVVDWKSAIRVIGREQRRRACRRGRARPDRRSRRHGGSSMKICGTVVRPLARWTIICLRLAAEIDRDLTIIDALAVEQLPWRASNRGRRPWYRFRRSARRAPSAPILRHWCSTHQLRRFHHARPADQLDPRRAGPSQRPGAGLGGASGGQHVVDQDDRLARRPPPGPRTSNAPATVLRRCSGLIPLSGGVRRIRRSSERIGRECPAAAKARARPAPTG